MNQAEAVELVAELLRRGDENRGTYTDAPDVHSIWRGGSLEPDSPELILIVADDKATLLKCTVEVVK